MKRNKRKYSRVDASVPFDIRLLSPDENSLKSRISDDDIVVDSSQLPEIENKDLHAWLNVINAKLDMLLLLKKENFSEMGFTPLNISAGGMRFSSRHPFEVGDFLEIRIVLNVALHRILYLAAVVMRVEQLSFKLNKYDIAVKFLEMTDEIRNELLKYDFNRRAEFADGKRASD